jgi:molybdopterin converting factor small subunit
MNFRRIAIELHAHAADLAGTRATSVDVAQEATGSDVKRALVERIPALAGLVRASALATDREYLSDGTAVAGEEKLHLIPPVSGG